MQKNITINGLKVGVTEDFLLRKFKDCPLKASMSRIHQSYPNFKILEPFEVASVVAYLISPIASGVSGEIVHVTKALSPANT